MFIGYSTTLLHNVLRSKEDKKTDWSKNAYQDRRRPSYLLGRPDAFSILMYFKSQYPHVKIVVGGQNAQATADSPELKRFIDYVVTGQGEVSAVRIAKRIAAERSGLNMIDLMPHTGPVLYDIKNNPVDHFNKPETRIRYHETDCIFPSEALPMEIARGCIFKCAFCAFDLNGKKLNEFNRDPQALYDDIMDAYTKYGTTSFMFADDTYNDSVEKIQLLHDLFATLPFKITWSSYIRIDLVVSNMKTAKLLYDSGLRGAMVGIESFHKKAGKTIGKGMDPQRLKDGLVELRKVPGWDEIIIATGMIIGLPYETKESLMESFEYLKSPDCPIDGYGALPLILSPGTKITNDLQKYGYKINESNGQWESEWMTEEEAINISIQWNSARARSNSAKETSLAIQQPITYFPRYENLGYSLSQMKNGQISFAEADERKHVKIMQYYERLNSLETVQ